jgi:hypothetical protein
MLKMLEDTEGVTSSCNRKNRQRNGQENKNKILNNCRQNTKQKRIPPKKGVTFTNGNN